MLVFSRNGSYTKMEEKVRHLLGRLVPPLDYTNICIWNVHTHIHELKYILLIIFKFSFFQTIFRSVKCAPNVHFVPETYWTILWHNGDQCRLRLNCADAHYNHDVNRSQMLNSTAKKQSVIELIKSYRVNLTSIEKVLINSQRKKLGKHSHTISINCIFHITFAFHLC